MLALVLSAALVSVPFTGHDAPIKPHRPLPVDISPDPVPTQQPKD